MARNDATPAAERPFPLKAVDGWNRFFFTPADPTPLGMVRICCGLLLLYVHIAYCFNLQDFFGKDAWIGLDTMNRVRQERPVLAPSFSWDGAEPPALPTDPEEIQKLEDYKQYWGVDPRYTAYQGHTNWSIWFHVTDPVWMGVVHGGILLSMFLFTIGCCTRVTAVLTWLGLLSFVNRSPTTLFGMDTIMIVIVLYLMIGPSGTALSVDRLFARWWARRRGRELPPPEPQVSANLALRLLQVHVSIIYLASGLSKLQGATWWSGTATWLTMANYEFSPMQFRLYMDFLQFVSERRWIWELVMTGGVFFTLAFEIAFPFLVWTPKLRWVMIVGAVFLHLGIAFFMGLVSFSIIMLVGVLSFVPAEAIHRFVTVLSSGRALVGAGAAPAGKSVTSLRMGHTG